MTIPKITQKHWIEAARDIGTRFEGFDVVYKKAIEIALTEQQESEYITAAQAIEHAYSIYEAAQELSHVKDGLRELIK